MSSRHIEVDPDVARRNSFVREEKAGEAQAALWDALAHLEAQGIDIGDRAKAMLRRREEIRRRAPKWPT